jgi:hypothetical protein
MDPKPPGSRMLLAPPPPGSSGALRLPPAHEPPPLDEHIVRPETREQLVRGRKVLAMPALPPHGDRHFKLDYVIGAHVKEGYVGSTDLLTRSAESSDFATDTCIRRAGIDPRTNTRYLEELAFEVVNEQSMRDITEQAQDLTARGVRRVVAIFVKKGDVCEWSAQAGAWKKLDPEGTFQDPTLARPLKVKELLDAAEADNAVARALLAKKNPVLVSLEAKSREAGHEAGHKEGRKEGHKEGREEGLLRAIELTCQGLGVELTEERRSRMGELDAPGLEGLLSKLVAERSWP